MGVKSLRLMIVVNTVALLTAAMKLLDTVQGPVFTTFSGRLKGAAYLK